MVRHGLAFVLLAYAHAVMAGVDEARPWLEETWDLMERRFWEPWHGLYADEASADWSAMSPYRGQNANMHACEAMLAAAQELFEQAIGHAWDLQDGGLHYGFAPSGDIRDADKYFWVQAGTLAAAALPGDRTGDASYWAWHAKIREYAWYRILTADNRKISDEKSPAGKVDHHTMGACYDVVPLLERRLARSPSLSGLRTT